MQISIQDAIELMNEIEPFNIPQTDEDIIIELPDEFTPNDLYDALKEALGDIPFPPRYRIIRVVRIPEDEEPEFCSRCGRPIHHVYYMLDTRETEREEDALPYGSTCVKEITGYEPYYIKRATEVYEQKIREMEEEEERKRYAKEWQVVNIDLIDALSELAEGSEHYSPIAHSFLSTIEEYGTLSENAMKYAQRIVEKGNNLVSKEEYDFLTDLYFCINYPTPLRLSRYDKFINDIFSKGIDYGFTYKQRDTILKILKKYRKQLKDPSRTEDIKCVELINRLGI